MGEHSAVFRTVLTPAFAALVCFSSAAWADGHAVRVGGTGALLRAMEIVATAYRERAPAAQISVLPSLGSSGGIRAVADGKIDIALSGRTLTPTERERGVIERHLGDTAWGFATSAAVLRDFASAEIADVYAGKIKSWPDGTPLRLVLRPQSDSNNTLIVRAFPSAAPAIESARLRPEIPVAGTDRDNASMALGIAGSFTAMTLAQTLGENSTLRFVAVDGRRPDLDGLRSGAYPLRRPFYVVIRPEPRPGVAAFMDFLWSPEGAVILGMIGILRER